MKQGLVQQQVLQQKINQSLIQSIQVLQFNSMELHDYINEIALDNPLIDEVVYDSNIEDHIFQPSGEAVSMDINPAEKNIYEKLKEQLMMIHVPKYLKPVIEYGIDSLDETGYLDLSLEEWALNCDTTIERTEEALSYIQKLEPYGVGARSLGECLLLQIRHMDRYEAYMEDLLLNHLEWFADLNYEALLEVYSIEEDDIAEIMEMIQSCNPRPAEVLDNAEPEYIVPEAKIYKEKETWKVNYYNWSSPTIILNESYNRIDDKAVKSFLKGKKEQVNLLKKAIQYRSSTIERVIYQLVEEQRAFFEGGVMEIRPLRLVDMAKKLKLHVSTISRTISQKYIETPHGIFSIKFFFQSGIKKDSGETASIVIKRRLMDLIEAENKQKPLSDQKIKEKLKEDYGYVLARRTVMKYRQLLNIPASYKRKKEK